MSNLTKHEINLLFDHIANSAHMSAEDIQELRALAIAGLSTPQAEHGELVRVAKNFIKEAEAHAFTYGETEWACCGSGGDGTVHVEGCTYAALRDILSTLPPSPPRKEAGLREALIGSDEELTRIGWLKGLVQHYEELIKKYPQEDVDPDATRQAIFELEQMDTACRMALSALEAK